MAVRASQRLDPARMGHRASNTVAAVRPISLAPARARLLMRTSRSVGRDGRTNPTTRLATQSSLSGSLMSRWPGHSRCDDEPRELNPLQRVTGLASAASALTPRFRQPDDNGDTHDGKTRPQVPLAQAGRYQSGQEDEDLERKQKDRQGSVVRASDPRPPSSRGTFMSVSRW